MTQNTNKRYSLILIAYFILLPLTVVFSQVNAPTSGQLLQAFQRLNITGSVLYVAAHPDDENTRLLAYLANELKLKTSYLSLTRGDGGQNLIGTEQGVSLGLIRTNELLAARSVDGAKQYFTRANDFGYSKNPEETFKKWVKDSVLADVVWTIRSLKPDVIICRFPTTGEGGHGHHTASAMLAEEAFDAAADPTKYPEQLKYVSIWKTKRLFWNTFNFGTTNTQADDQLKVDVGLFNPLLGMYYGEIAAISRTMHKSQGFGSAKSRGTAVEYFKQLKGETVKNGLFDGIETSWKRFEGTEKIQKLIQKIISSHDALHPEKSIAALSELHQLLRTTFTKDKDLEYWLKQKQIEVEELLLSCAGWWGEAISSTTSAIPGSSVTINTQSLAQLNNTVKWKGIKYPVSDSIFEKTYGANVPVNLKHECIIPLSTEYNQPYWLKEGIQDGIFTVKNQLLRGKPLNDAALQVTFLLQINGIDLNVIRPVVYKTVDPVKGEKYRPFEVLPAVTINPLDEVVLFPNEQAKNIRFKLKATTGNVQGEFHVDVPLGWVVEPKVLPVLLKSKGEELTITVKVTPTSTEETTQLKASVLLSSGITCNQAIQRIDYDHIPGQFILSSSEVKLLRIALKKSGTKIGYIAGAGDEVPACIEQMGYEVVTLSDDQLSTSDLSVFDAIVTGVRAYNTNERLQVHHSRLMDYVSKGGNLIVQYNTNSRVGPVKSKIGPYPFTISRNRVTDETAEMRFNLPSHPALIQPNTITKADFDSWIQERGIYFATEVDANYVQPLSTNDPNEQPDLGSLIHSSYGKGNFVYTGLAFFRELPAGVPGAYKLFANLLSLPKKN